MPRVVSLIASGTEIVSALGFGDALVGRSHECDLPPTVANLPALTERSDWQALRAVRDGRVFVIDGNHYFNRPGPRLVDSAEILAEILHPETYDLGHKGKGWVRFA